MEEAGLASLRPGDNTYEVNDSMIRVLHKYYKDGEVEYSRPGHGLGYSYEDPVVSLAFPQPWDIKAPPKENATSSRTGPTVHIRSQSLGP